jgi:hypothetical protein
MGKDLSKIRALSLGKKYSWITRLEIEVARGSDF